ncbi:hypothetical protein [Luteimicrobium sp. DT211]
MAPEVKAQLNELRRATGMTQRGIVEHLIAEAWNRYQQTGTV